MKKYATPQAFRSALEATLRKRAGTAPLAFERRRQTLAFDRLLVRLAQYFGERVLLKGGFALELRLATARATRDVDLRLLGPLRTLPDELTAACRLDVGDWFTFTIRPHKTPNVAGAVYDGARFMVQAQIAGKNFADPFGLDVAFGDVLTDAPDLVDGCDDLNFCDVPTPKHRVYPRTSHIAEKLHAYTLPHDGRENSRVKDLPDIALLATLPEPLSSSMVRAACTATFAQRKTHDVPTTLPAPPPSWRATYAAMAVEFGLPWADIDAVTSAARAFLDPVLSTSDDAMWEPSTWTWHPR